MEIVTPLHPAWDRCSPAVRKLHARNAAILLSDTVENILDDHVVVPVVTVVVDVAVRFAILAGPLEVAGVDRCRGQLAQSAMCASRAVAAT